MQKLYFIFVLGFLSQVVFSQYSFPACAPAHVVGNSYTTGQQVSKAGKNYVAKYWTATTPPGTDWDFLGPCGDPNIALGTSYPNQKRIIGYMPSWNTTYNFNDYDPSKITHVVVAFLSFQTNNTNFASNDFASIAFTPQSLSEVNSVLTTQNVLSRSHAVGTKVSVAIGGAIDYGFLWLMNKYVNDDAKLEEIAQLIVNYATANGIDGVDLDMECWWADPAISGTSDQGGRVRGDKWGGPDQGPHPAGIGLRKLAQKIKAIQPNLLTSAAVFGTSWYGNNYDDTMANYLDWMGLMTYDFTGSWSATPHGPHTALYKVPLNTYPNQTADNPIYSVQDALEYWQGIATPTWNHDGGFSVPRAKLCIGSPFYGYDFSTPKPNGGNGFVTLTYKDIVTTYPSAPTSYDPLHPQNYNGYIAQNGKKIYYETPMSLRKKYDYIKDYGHQGIIIWELTNDLHPSNPNALLYQLNQEVLLSGESFSLGEHTQFYTHGNVLHYTLDPNDMEPSRLTVYDLTGRLVYDAFLSNQMANGTITLAVSSGIYIVHYRNHAQKVMCYQE